VSMLAVAQAAAEYGGLTSSTGGLSNALDRAGDLAGRAGAELEKLVSVAIANPALTLLVAALVCVAVIVRSSSVR